MTPFFRNLSFTAVLAASLAFGLVGCTKKEQSADSGSAQQAETSAATAQNTSELKIEDLKVGSGAEATPGKMVTVHYTGTLTNGQKFDSSVDRGEPFPFQLGAGQVIQGWEKGVQGMKVGGKRKLTIPPELGYGATGMGPIPPNSTLIFEVELLNVQ